MASTDVRAAPGPGGLCNSTPCRGSAHETYRKTPTIPATSSDDSNVCRLGAQWVFRLGAQWDIWIRLQSMQGRRRGIWGQSNSPPPLLPQHHPLGNGSTRRPYDGQSRHRNRTSVSATPPLAFIQKPWQPWRGVRCNLLFLSLLVNSWNLCYWSLKTWSLATVPHWLRFNVFETLRGKRHSFTD